MLSLLFSLLFSALSVAACIANDVGTGLTITAGIAGFLVGMLLVSRVVARGVGRVQENLQQTLQEGQKRISRDIQQFQSKPGGNVKSMQARIEKKQQEMIRQALDRVEDFDPFRKWSLLMGRQINTMKLQFHYQLKEYDQVDELLAKRGPFSKPLLSEPMAVGMKMARQYAHGEIEAMEKTFKKRLIWFRGDRATLLYGVMSWAYVRQGEIDKARLLLVEGKERTGNETLARNWELLSNGKEKKFSNKGLGEEWYALGLENPPAPKAQRMRGNARPMY